MSVSVVKHQIGVQIGKKKTLHKVRVILWSLKEIIRQWKQIKMTMDFDSNKAK